MKDWLNYIYKNTNFIYKAFIFLSALLLIVYFLPKQGKFKYDFKKNTPWQYETLYAPNDFSIKKTDVELKDEKQKIEKSIPYFIKKTPINLKGLTEEIDNSIKKYNNGLNASKVDSLIRINHKVLPKIYEVGLIEQVPNDILKRKINLVEGTNLKEVHPAKIYTTHDIKAILKNYIDPENPLLKDLLEIYFKHLKINLSLDRFYYDKTLKEQLQNISINKGLVLKGTQLIGKGELIDNQKYNILTSLKNDHSTQQYNAAKTRWIYLGYTVLVAIVLLMLFLFLWKYRPEIYNNNVKISLIVFNMVLLIILTNLMVNYNTTYVYIVPLTILPLLLKAFFDARVGLFVHVLTILLLGFIVANSFEFIFLQIMAGIVTILTVSELTKRSNLVSSVSSIILIYIIGYFAFHLIHEGNIKLISGQVFMFFLLNGILTIALSNQLILLYERVFGLVSDVSLLEISNTNTKLLKRLADKAPGTFNHSMQVANLAEAAAHEIKANALLVRAGALYHDIGKMLNPFYFTENQTSGVNRHDDLDPVESAKIIINHVLDGVELARKNNLPDRVIDFIRTHHGRSLVQYFYKKALETDPNIDKELFRYPGPNPFSKETAILMMADSVEASSKSLREPTAAKIEAFVDKIIDNQLHSGLLDNADITLKEILNIKKLFKKKLKNIYHLRIEYPE